MIEVGKEECSDLGKWQIGVVKLKKAGQYKVFLTVVIILWLSLGFTQMFRISFSVVCLIVVFFFFGRIRQV